MNLKLTNQQKQYLMYFAIFVLGYLMCMYYPVHKNNGNMPILEGFDPKAFNINDFYSVGVDLGNGGSASMLPERCMAHFQELSNNESCNDRIRDFINNQYPEQDIYIRKSPDTRDPNITISRDELLDFLKSEKVCTHRYEDGLSLCAKKGNEGRRPCGPDFDENCEPLNSNNNNNNR